jgi:hypothetical protein
VDIRTTLGELGVEDRGPLTSQERTARIADLLRSRSGVYLPAAMAPSVQDESRPKRDAYPPGRAFYYNNWDFNALGSILRQVTGVDLFDDFARTIAVPIGMEDYRPSDGALVLEPRRSAHPAYAFRMSARDLARFGTLYLQRGRWDTTQVLPADWIADSWENAFPFRRGGGYGYLWHLGTPGMYPSDGPLAALDPHARFLAAGTGGQMVMVLPDLHLVLVHLGDTDHDRPALDPRRGAPIRDADVLRLFAMIVGARELDPVPIPDLTTIAPVPLPNLRPEPPERTAVPISSEELDLYPGEYRTGAHDVARVFRHGERRLFVASEMLGETELFRTASGTYFVYDAPFLTFAFDRDESGAVSALRGREHDRTVEALRVR